MTFDPVEKPAHYNQHGVEAIQAIEASMSSEEFLGYLKGNAIKYLWRYRYKDNPLQDLDKALWYLKLLKEKFKGLPKESEYNAKNICTDTMSLSFGRGPFLSGTSINAATGSTMLGESDVPRGAGAIQEDVGCGVRCDESAGTVTRQIGMSNRERQASILSEIAEADEAARHVPRHARVGGCETSRKFADIEAHGF